MSALIKTTKEQEHALVTIIKNSKRKDAEVAWVELYTLLHPLIYAIAEKYISGGNKDKLLIGVGRIGLKKAIEKYKTDSNFKFSIYATWFIRNEIHKLLGLPPRKTK